MNLFTLSKGRRIAFGHFRAAEIDEMQLEGWKVESVVYLKRHLPKRRRKPKRVLKQVAVNKHGIPIRQ